MSFGLGKIRVILILFISLGIVFLGPADRLYDMYEISINKYLRISLLSIMLVYFAITGLSFTKYKFKFGSFILLFLSVLLIYSFNSHSTTTSLIIVSKALLWMLAAVVSFRLRLFDKLDNAILFRSVCIAIPLGCLSSLYVKFFGDLRTSQNVGAYGIIWLAPLLMISAGKSKIIKSILLFAIVITLLLILKRGAIIAFSVGTLLYFFADYASRNDLSGKIKYFISFIFLSMLVGFLIFLFREALYTRFIEDPTYRDIFYNLLYNNWKNSDLINFTFGFGSLSVVSFTAYYFGTEGLVAHSDWMQLTHDYGLVGIFLMLYFYYSLCTLLYSCKSRKLYLAKILAFSIGAMMCINLYSGQFFTPNTFLFGLFIGILSADIKRKGV